MSWPDFLTPWAAGPAPGLPLGDFLRRGGDGFCGDCDTLGRPCPDHRQDPAPGTGAAS